MPRFSNPDETAILTFYSIDTHFDTSKTAFENIVGKGQITRNEQFLLFPQCFLLDQIMYPYLSIFLTSYHYLLLNFKSLKFAYNSLVWERVNLAVRYQRETPYNRCR